MGRPGTACHVRPALRRCPFRRWPRQRAARALTSPCVSTGGWHKSASSPCPPNYPDGAPREHCGHYSFVEIDAATAYRSALAYVASGDERYARQAVRAVTAWAETNKVFGLSDRNGPLEAAW